jgi:aldose 1-epimerase
MRKRLLGNAITLIVATLGGLVVTRNVLAAETSRELYGVTAQGERVEAYTLRNDRGMRVKVLSYGGILNEVVVPDKKGSCGNVVLTLPDLQAYETRSNFSSLLGRYANRIANSGFTLDGVRYELKSNASGVASHGGEQGFSSRNWSGQPFKAGKSTGVVLSYVSDDGESGFPGKLAVRVRYTVDDDNTLSLDYRATTDKPTVLNLSHHVYFNLSGEPDVYDHRAQVLADRYTLIDARKVPTGEIAPVAGTPLDLRQLTRLGDRVKSKYPQITLGNGFDHNFVLNKPSPDALAVAARVESRVSGRMLELSTTQPGLQLYTANGFNGSLHNSKGQPIVQGAGVALETQHFPDSPNQPKFPSTVLRPGEEFRSTTRFKFAVAGLTEAGRCKTEDPRSGFRRSERLAMTTDAARSD